MEGTEETVRVVAMEKDFHVDCYVCEVPLLFFAIDRLLRVAAKNSQIFIVTRRIQILRRTQLCHVP